MERKNGKFVGKKNVSFSQEEREKIERMARVLTSMFSDNENDYSIKLHDKTIEPDTLDLEDKTILITIKLPVYSDNKVVKRKGSSTYFLQNDAYMTLWFRNQEGYDGNGGTETQADCFIRFHGIWEREYRHKYKYLYDPNPHFGYGYSVDTIWEEMITMCMARLWDDFGHIALGMHYSKVSNYKVEKEKNDENIPGAQ